MLRAKPLVMIAALGAACFSYGASHAEAPQRTQPMIWGVVGHPTWADYGDWVPANVDRQAELIHQLGCTFYRCSLEQPGPATPTVLDKIIPKMQAAGITVLPIFPVSLSAANDAKTCYDKNYARGKEWAAYAISRHFHIPYWELGNELENWDLVKIIGDGAASRDYPDKTPGGFVAIATGLNGAYHGIQDGYAEGRAKGMTDVVPQMLYGCTYRHWGLLAKIAEYDGSLPCDIISWHWYEPNHGLFSASIRDEWSGSHGRTPAECLADFKSHTHPDQPMDVWITEANRSVHTSKGWDNGSVAETPTGEDWAAEAQLIKSTIQDLKSAPNVKAIFIYELLDDYFADKSNPSRLRSEGHYGLVTGLNGKFKDAFYTYQNEIKESH